MYAYKYYEKEIDSAEVVRHYHYIYGDNGVVALNLRSTTYVPDTIGGSNNDTLGNDRGIVITDSTYYIHTDHLGSYCAITNAGKKTVQHNYFDPWGNMPKLFLGYYHRGDTLIIGEAYSGGDSIPTSEISTLNFSLTNRGFTGHEHYPYFQIINMNGRLYDPVIGRFFSPDNFVQIPHFTQSYNRYTYALNNPLKYKDPTGQWYDDGYGDFWSDRDRLDGLDNPDSPAQLERVTIEDCNRDPFGYLWGIDDGVFDNLLQDFTPGGGGDHSAKSKKYTVKSSYSVPRTEGNLKQNFEKILNAHNQSNPSNKMSMNNANFNSEVAYDHINNGGMDGTDPYSYNPFSGGTAWGVALSGVGVGLAVVAESKIPYASPIAFGTGLVLGTGQLTYYNKINPNHNKNNKNFNNITTTVGMFGGVPGNALSLIMVVAVPPAADYFSRKMAEFEQWMNNSSTWSNWYYFGP